MKLNQRIEQMELPLRNWIQSMKNAHFAGHMSDFACFRSNFAGNPTSFDLANDPRILNPR